MASPGHHKQIHPFPANLILPYWQRLIQPSANIPTKQAQWRAQVLASFLVIVLLLTALMIPLWAYFTDHDALFIPIFVMNLLPISIAYGLARTRHYTIGSYLYLTTLTFAITYVANQPSLDPLESLLVLHYLIVPVFTAGVFLPLVGIIGIAIISLGIVIVTLHTQHAATFLYWHYLIFLLSMTAIIIVMRTILKNYVRKLEITEAQYRSLFNQSHDAVFLLTLSGEHFTANQRAADMLGYSLAEILTLSLHNLTAESNASENTRERLIRGELIPRYERQFRRKDGTLLPVEINAELIRGDDNTPLYIQSVVTDISERKAAERALAETIRKNQEDALKLAIEQERVRVLRNFMTDASHEFRTPLTIIKNSFHLISKLTDAEKQQAQIIRANAQIQRITLLLDRLLALVTLDGGEPLVLSQTYMNILLPQLVEKFQASAQAKQLTLTLHMDNLPPLVTSAEELPKALECLLENAVRYTATGGQIHITATSQPHQMVISIQDTGVGIAAADLPHIFDRFWRKDTAPSTHGLGLGLALAQKIIEMHHGTITATSQLGQGSRFTVTLPLTPKATPIPCA